jgi:menaquinol-cytochrome c reductase iron-sulfur subunit
MKESNAEPPQPCREPTPEEITRRKFLERTSIALAALGAAIVTLPLVGFIFAPLFRKEPAVWRTVGTVGNFKIGETSEVTFLDSSPLPWAGVTAKTAGSRRRGCSWARARAESTTRTARSPPVLRRVR